MKLSLAVITLLLLTACETSFETQPPRWTSEHINVHRAPGTEQNVTYSIIDSGVKQMSEGPEQVIKPAPYKPLRYKR